MAMAALMAGLKKNASNPGRRRRTIQSFGATRRKFTQQYRTSRHDDAIADGQKILNHILGGKKSQTERALAKTAGIDQAQIAQLLAIAAPTVLASLGRAKQEQGLDASALAGLITEESLRLEKGAPAELGGLMSFLDQDGDGDFKDDMFEAAGKKLLGGLFGRR